MKHRNVNLLLQIHSASSYETSPFHKNNFPFIPTSFTGLSFSNISLYFFFHQKKSSSSYHIWTQNGSVTLFSILVLVFGPSFQNAIFDLWSFSSSKFSTNNYYEAEFFLLSWKHATSNLRHYLAFYFIEGRENFTIFREGRKSRLRGRRRLCRRGGRD